MLKTLRAYRPRVNFNPKVYESDDMAVLEEDSEEDAG